MKKLLLTLLACLMTLSSYANVNLTISDFTGDSGSGGTAGTVPAPSAGDAAAGKILGAGGGWTLPSGGGGGAVIPMPAPYNCGINIWDDYPSNGTYGDPPKQSGWPIGWGFVPAQGSVLLKREASIVVEGDFSLKLTRSGTDTEINQGISALPGFWPAPLIAGRTYTFGMMVNCSTANASRLYITDGVSTGYSSYHTGSGNWEWLTATLTFNANPTTFTIGAKIQNVDAVAYFDASRIAEGSSLPGYSQANMDLDEMYVIFGTVGNPVAGQISYLYPTGFLSGAGGGGQTGIRAPFNYIADKMYFCLSGGPGAGKNATVTFQIGTVPTTAPSNMVDTPLACTISGTSVEAEDLFSLVEGGEGSWFRVKYFLDAGGAANVPFVVIRLRRHY